MRKEDLKASFDKIKPDKTAEIRMLNKILSHSGKEKNMARFNFRKAVPALAMAFIVAGGLFIYKMLPNANPTPGETPLNSREDMASTEDMVAPLLNQFQIDGKHYIFISDELRIEYGFPDEISENDIGYKITTITKGPDQSLIGSEVYYYLPAGSEAVVAVKKDMQYSLYKFFTFESYNNNQDEDAVEYLKLYGINKAEDIAKIQFIVHSEQSKLEGGLDIRSEITDKNEITQFYDFYSKLKNSSDKYFDRLFNYQPRTQPNTSVEIDPAVPGFIAPDNIATPVAPDYIGPEVIVEPVEPDAVPDIAPNKGSFEPAIGPGVASDTPKRTTREPVPQSNQVHIAEDLITDSVTAGDTPVTSGQHQGMMDMGGTSSNGGASVALSQGSAVHALDNPVIIRIYNQKGIYYDSYYYRNIGFISRYEISQEFIEFLNNYIR
ncbi:MAG: hypothetical protein GX957_11025 [Clostridiaceae bacterium]|nr:hypothetical protein [Clostridiaceae bacterium]